MSKFSETISDYYDKKLPIYGSVVGAIAFVCIIILSLKLDIRIFPMVVMLAIVAANAAFLWAGPGCHEEWYKFTLPIFSFLVAFVLGSMAVRINDELRISAVYIIFNVAMVLSIIFNGLMIMGYVLEDTTHERSISYLAVAGVIMLAAVVMFIWFNPRATAGSAVYNEIMDTIADEDMVSGNAHNKHISKNSDGTYHVSYDVTLVSGHSKETRTVARSSVKGEKSPIIIGLALAGLSVIFLISFGISRAKENKEDKDIVTEGSKEIAQESQDTIDNVVADSAATEAAPVETESTSDDVTASADEVAVADTTVEEDTNNEDVANKE